MELPARIGKYELQEFLGGGMSHVYRARDTVIGRTVAVKILTEAGCADQDVRARFLAEARMSGNLAHDHILSIYDFGEDDQNRPFMVMEFLRGDDLRSLIRSGRTGDAANKIKIAIQVAKALEYTHSQKIVHRDLKPENIHINTSGVVKLIDFGIAKTEGLQLTQAGFILGTPFYMAPEQVMGQDITEQVDVYSFGILLFELFTGQKPIQAEKVERIFYAILNEPINLEPLHQAGTPQSICDLIQRCTAKRPQDRPQGFGPIVTDLEAISKAKDEATVALPTPSAMAAAATVPTPAPATAATQAPTPAPMPAPAPSGRPAWLLPAVLVVIAGLGGGLYFATRPKPTPSEPAKSAAPPPAVEPVPEGMVLVPAGPFLYGKDNQSVTLPAYYIDRTEVSNGDFARFCAATGRSGCPTGAADLPAANITIQDARDYAAWANKRLPTSQEWEKAARYTDGRLYPWGNEADASRANVNSAGAQPVNAFADFAGPFKTVQMTGNVWEFIDETVTPDNDERQYFSAQLKPPPTASEAWHPIRGGSFQEKRLLSTVISQAVPERWKSLNIGFRCVRNVK